MLRIRREQMAVLEKHVFEQFIQSIAEHLYRFFPDKCDVYTRDGLFEIISYGIERAKTYGIESQRDVCIYIDLMFLLGRDFDAELATTWVGEILNDEKLKYLPTKKIETLWEVFFQNTNQVTLSRR
jgi:hypothetical protein